jgi:3-oxoadipate enol-lactonase
MPHSGSTDRASAWPLPNVRVGGPNDAPVVVFIHSLGTDLTIWDRVIDCLGPAVRSICFDLRGHGQTPPTPPPYSIQMLAVDAVRLLDQLAIPQATLCGISVGALIALQSAAERPAVAQAVIVCDTPYRGSAPDMWNQRIEAVTGRGMASISDAVIPRWFSDGFRVRCPGEVDRYRRMLEHTSVAGYAGVCAALRDVDADEIVRKVRCPALVLCGADDQATPPDTNEALASALGGAFVRIEGAAHLPCVEQPEAVAGQIAAFVKERRHV